MLLGGGVAFFVKSWGKGAAAYVGADLAKDFTKNLAENLWKEQDDTTENKDEKFDKVFERLATLERQVRECNSVQRKSGLSVKDYVFLDAWKSGHIQAPGDYGAEYTPDYAFARAAKEALGENVPDTLHTLLYGGYKNDGRTVQAKYDLYKTLENLGFLGLGSKISNSASWVRYYENGRSWVSSSSSLSSPSPSRRDEAHKDMRERHQRDDRIRDDRHFERAVRESHREHERAHGREYRGPKDDL